MDGEYNHLDPTTQDMWNAMSKSERDKMTKILVEQLEKTAIELNSVLGLEPEIQYANQKPEALAALVKEASQLVLAADVLTSATEDIILALQGDFEIVTSSTKTPSKPETKPEPKPEPKPKGKTKVKDPEPKKIKPEDPEPKDPKVTVTSKITRSVALVEALREFGGEAFTTAQVTARSREIYEQARNVADEDLRGSRSEWMVTRGILTALGMLEKPNHTTFKFTEERK